jgi:hypothetical protein
VPTGSQVTTDTLTDKDKPKPAFTPDMAGKYVFRLIVNDGQVDSAPDEVELTAAIANVPPNADAGADQTALVGVTVIVNGNSSTDPDNGPQLLTFAWTFVQVPVGSTRTTADISGASQPQASFVPDVQGTYILRLTVSDGPASDTDDVEIVVTVQNVPPIANAGGDQTVTRGTEVTLDGRGSSDPDNGPQPLAYSWRLVSKPSGSQLTDADIIGSETATPKLLPDVTGSYVVELEVFDGAASAFDNVVVEVRQSAQCPLSQGYWKNHSAVWPVTALQLGAQTYSKAELLSLLRNPSTGDASLILARQLIAAKLNIAAGSDSTPVSATITDADQHLNAFTGKLPYKVKTSSTTGQTTITGSSRRNVSGGQIERERNLAVMNGK